MIEVALLALLLLQLKHFVCDFVTQTPYQLRYKGVYGHPAGLLHVGHHAVGSAIVLAVLNGATPLSTSLALIVALLAAESFFHYHVDWAKEQLIKPYVKEQGAAYWAIFGLDQFLHQASYVAMAYVLIRD